MGCDHHHADRSDVHRQRDPVGFRPAVQGERSEKLHHRVESFLLAGGLADGLVPADTQYRSELSGVCTDDIVVHVPGADAQCLAAIHGLPRLRGPECRDVQQPLVHDGQRVAHRLVVAFVDSDRKFPLGKDLISELDLRVKNRATVNDLGSLHAVHPDRQVVYGLGVRLQQGGVHIEIGCHIPGYPQPVGRLLLVRQAHPAARQHA